MTIAECTIRYSSTVAKYNINILAVYVWLLFWVAKKEFTVYMISGSLRTCTIEHFPILKTFCDHSLISAISFNQFFIFEIAEVYKYFLFTADPLYTTLSKTRT